MPVADDTAVTRSPPSTSPSSCASRTSLPRVCNAAFSECDGLEMTMEVKTIKEGGNNAQLHRLAGPLALRHADAQARHDRDVRPVGLVRAASSRTRASAPTARSCCSRRTASTERARFVLSAACRSSSRRRR